MNLDLWPREKAIQNQAMEGHEMATQDPKWPYKITIGHPSPKGQGHAKPYKALW